MAKHLPFYPSIIFSAIALSIFGGFATGAYIVFVIAFEKHSAINISTLMQIHGHLQLLSWTGLFIIGVSIYKLPRLMSIKPLRKSVAWAIVFPIVSGLILRTIFQVFLATTPHSSVYRQALFAAVSLESLGIFLFLYFILAKLLSYKANPNAYAAAGIKPFLLVSLLGWLSYACANVILGWQLLHSSSSLFDLRYNSITNEIYLHLVLLPTCFAFSISIFPIFLKLRSPNWPVARLALMYGTVTLLYLYAKFLPQTTAAHVLTVIATVLRTAVIIWLVIEIDFLRLKAPWYKKFRDKENREHNPPRKKSADYGQFGNFQWLIYTAYIWLCIAVLHDLVSISGITIQSESISRHFYALGFVTHLILGVAVRMVPGFLGQNRIAYPGLVHLSFALILFATSARTLPILFSTIDNPVLRSLYGISGICAILAICALGANLACTVRQEKRSLVRSFDIHQTTEQ